MVARPDLIVVHRALTFRLGGAGLLVAPQEGVSLVPLPNRLNRIGLGGLLLNATVFLSLRRVLTLVTSGEGRPGVHTGFRQSDFGIRAQRDSALLAAQGSIAQRPALRATWRNPEREARDAGTARVREVPLAVGIGPDGFDEIRCQIHM